MALGGWRLGFYTQASSNSEDFPSLINEPQVRPHFDVTGVLLHNFGQGRESVKWQGYLKKMLRVKYFSKTFASAGGVLRSCCPA
jgi:hypothetical protein